MKKIVSKRIFIIISAFISLVLSCSDSTPAIGATFYSLVYDFTENSDRYDMRLSVFVQPSSDERRLESMEVSFSGNDYVWKIEKPECERYGRNAYVGWRNLKWPDGSEFENGVYTVTFKDKAGRIASSEFTLNKLDSMERKNGRKAKAKEVSNRIAGTECQIKRIIIFDEIGMEVFCGLYSPQFDKKESILKIFPDADTKQVYYTTDDSSYVILLPKETI